MRQACANSRGAMLMTRGLEKKRDHRRSATSPLSHPIQNIGQGLEIRRARMMVLHALGAQARPTPTNFGSFNLDPGPGLLYGSSLWVSPRLDAYLACEMSALMLLQKLVLRRWGMILNPSITHLRKLSSAPWGMIGRFGPDYKEDCRHRFRSKASPGSRRCATILTSFGLCIHVYELDQCM